MGIPAPIHSPKNTAFLNKKIKKKVYRELSKKYAPTIQREHKVVVAAVVPVQVRVQTENKKKKRWRTMMRMAQTPIVN